MAGKNKPGRGVDKKGRSKGNARHDRLYAELTGSAAWLSLSGNAVKVLIDLRRTFNGTNNGALAYSIDKAAKRLGIGKATVKRMLDELQEKGFIKKTSAGGFSQRMAATFALTDRPIGDAMPTNEWRQWPPKSTAQNQNITSEMEPHHTQDGTKAVTEDAPSHLRRSDGGHSGRSHHTRDGTLIVYQGGLADGPGRQQR